MATVSRPVHGVDLGQMALEISPGLHPDSREGFGVVLGDFLDCTESMVSIWYTGNPMDGS